MSKGLDRLIQLPQPKKIDVLQWKYSKYSTKLLFLMKIRTLKKQYTKFLNQYTLFRSHCGVAFKCYIWCSTLNSKIVTMLLWHSSSLLSNNMLKRTQFDLLWFSLKLRLMRLSWVDLFVVFDVTLWNSKTATLALWRPPSWPIRETCCNLSALRCCLWRTYSCTTCF